MTIEAVLFDFGGVFTPSPFGVIRQAGPELGLDPEVLLTLCFGPYDEDTDHPWHRLERGELSLADARVELAALARGHSVADFDPLTVLARVGSEDPDRATLVAHVRALRSAGVRTGLVTNNVAEFGDGWRRMIPVDELFEVVIDSSQVGMRKPDTRVYLLALDALDIAEPSTTLFVDDHPGNLVGAAAVGMQTMLVEPDRAPLLAALADLAGPAARTPD